ncbi:MAG: autotransporter domain-containing protein, partial [Phycisphaerales bacterium]
NAAFAVIQAQDTSMVDVGGDLGLTGNSAFEAGTTLKVGCMLDLADGAMLDLQGTDLDAMNLTATGGIKVNSGATLMGNATINTSQLEYGGKVMVGATGSTTGLLTLQTGNLVSDTGGELNFGLTGDLVMDLTDGYGQNSLIDVVAGSADFTQSSSIVLDVQGTTYIPTDRRFTIIKTTGGVTGNATVTTNRDQSITRGSENGAGGWMSDADALSIWAQSSAEYTNTLSGPDFETGLMLDSFIPFANGDPGNSYGELLGQLDQIDNAAEYAAAVEGLGPTTQVSTIQLAANTQYFQVLRNEIQRRYATVKQRTPAPFRLSNGTEYASSQDDAVQAKIRRNIRQPSTAEGFGVFWGRDITTKDEGDIAGISGNEYGGLGGFAWDLSEQWVAGVNLGYSQISGDVNGGFGSTRVGTVRGGGFVSWFEGGGLFLDVALAGAWNHYDFTRFVPNTGLNADSKADGFQVDFSVGGGYRVELGESWAITPEASLLYSYVNTGDINEDTSSAAALSISPGDLNALVGRVGGTLSWSALPGLVLDGSLGWQGNFNFNGNYEVGLANQKANFAYAADNQTINTAYYGLGVNWTPTYNVNVSLQYEGRNGEGLNSNMFYGGVSIGF